MEMELAKHSLWFPRQRYEPAERAFLPSIAEVFDDLCFANAGVPPSPSAFIDEFVDRYKDDCPQLFGSLWPGVQARLLRAHPSFVRERHLEAMLSDQGVLYARSVSADQRHGIDLIVIHGKSAIRVSTFVDTRYPRSWRKRKISRSTRDGYFIELPLTDEYVHKVGDYHLYGPWHVEAIRMTLPDIVQTPSARVTVVPKPRYVHWTSVDHVTLEDLLW